MRWPSALVLVLALFAAGCSAPSPPQGWSVDRQAPGAIAGTDAEIVICEEMRDLALGTHAGDEDLTDTLTDMARISAVVGATAALPLLNRVTTAIDDGAELIEIHDDLVEAAATIDPASWDFCRLPLFTAVYATTGWPSCHGELVIPVAGYTELRAEPGCSRDGIPSFLTCFADAAPHLPVDCNSSETVQVRDGEWVRAGAPRDVSPPTTTTTEPVIPDETTTTTTTIPAVSYLSSQACRSVALLFTGPDPVDGSVDDLDRLRFATASLGSEIAALVDEFIAVNTGEGDLDTFEANVLALDMATVAECGLPLISAWDALAGGTEELPCWLETGLAFPAYTPTGCRD